MIDVERCKNCPIAGLCPAMKERAPHYCDRIDPNSEKYNPKFIAILEKKVGKEPIMSVDVVAEMREITQVPGEPPKVGKPVKDCNCGKNRPMIDQVPRNPVAIAQAQARARRARIKNGKPV